MQLFSFTTLCQLIFVYFYFSGAVLHSSVVSQHALVGTTVILSCNYTLPSSEFAENIDVWWKVSRSGMTETLFASQNKIITKMTERFDVDEAWLLRGNASMIIRNVTLGDEGEYSCGVIIQPDQYDHTVHLKLSAQPSVSLPGLISVAPGEEKMLRCDITKFYPEQLRVMWWNETGAEPVRDVCTGVPVPNADGTFNVTSRFTVKTETLGSEVTVYKCLVEHRSFSDIYSKNVTIRVQAPVQLYNTLTIVTGTIVFTVFCTVLTTGAAVFFYRSFHTAPVSVSEIIKPDVIYASTLTKLSCRIIGVGPKQLKVQWFKLSSHNSENSEEPERNREADSLTGDWSLQNNTEMESENKVHTSILSLKLTINDDQTKYCCVVHCRKEKIIRSTTLSIKVEPELLQISSQPQIPRLGHSLVLCCRIEKFYPENIHLEWHKQGEELQQSSVQFGPFSDHHNLYSMWSKTELTVTNLDIGTVCICRVHHSSFYPPFYKDVKYHISTKGHAPNVAFIQCDPAQPHLGSECTLNLCVKDFSPDPVTVTWFKDREQISEGVFNSPASLNVNGLYSMWTFLKLTPSVSDISSVFKCVVEHMAQIESEERHFTLSHLIKV